MNAFLTVIKQELAKAKSSSQSSALDPARTDKERKQQQADSSTVAFQELYELTQRKFLKQLIQFGEMIANSVEYPTLYCIDLVESSKLNSSTTQQQQQQQQQNEILAEKNKIEDETRGSSAASRARPQTARRVDTISSSEYVPCIRAMCEFQEGWHPSSSFISITSNSSNETGSSSLLASFASYLTRVMSIVKNGPSSSELQVLLSAQGRRILGDLETKSSVDHKDIVDSYVALVKHVLGKHEQEQEQQQQDKLQHGDNFEGSSKMGLIRCELKSGKTMWLCKKHIWGRIEQDQLWPMTRELSTPRLPIMST